MEALCRDCLSWFDHDPGPRCPACGRRRVLAHAELGSLSIAHMDCDAFYASVEKRDDPALADRPLIVGGGRRGVVSTCCYIARIAGVRSAMPMFRAIELCPDAVVLRPRMEHYAAVSRQIRARMEALTPLVEPLSLDEAFLDLSGTQRLFGAPPALSMARLAQQIEDEVGVTVSVGLSHNKYLAKLASDLDKPRGFSVIGRAETRAFLAPRPVRSIWGVGAAMAAKLEADGLRRNADLAAADPVHLTARYGSAGQRLWELAQGIDRRRVSPNEAPKSISSEITFDDDIADADALTGHLWRLALRTSDRAKAKGIVGHGVTVKLKGADFRQITRQMRLERPTNLAETIFRAAEPLLAGAMDHAPFRLIGVGIGALEPESVTREDDALFTVADSPTDRAERATDQIRARFGRDAIIRGRGLR
ncbi:DNA polymerase IV [Limibaculum sp. M0105]|uniref:DNA polymerase IV n=1 Tax=Thermohalobaculum xanthum TaxID=2753746 RepID=A0A8J7SD62_9RHOB|nr:DNA polymerase IV [Thermohalobaculum xanthum]MBK0398641.1 DNA polymerase IV [Thermohalobaculum xanthum]